MILRSHLELEWPLGISLRRGTGNDLGAALYVPGSTVRGALAEAYLEAHARQADAGFEDLFLKGRVRFGDLRINLADPWPLSARVCRDLPEEHRPADLLIAAAAHEAIAPECAACKAKRHFPGGFLKLRSGPPPVYCSEPIESRRVAHVQIQPELLRAQDTQFHTARILERDQVFEGSIWVDDGMAKELETLIGQERTLYLGRGRTRGLGRARLSTWPVRPRSTEEIESALKTLNGVAGCTSELSGKVVFICTLLSRTILYDRWLLARPVLDTSDIAKGLDSGECKYECKAHFARMCEVAGWHANAQLPKTGAAALEAGSAFLFATKERVADAHAEYRRLAGILAATELLGVGERCEEGFGEAVFCHPFHNELHMEQVEVA